MNEVKHLYIHIPFCKSICSYCDFKRYVGQEKHIDAYLVKIIRNLSRFKNTKMDSIYIGGGTPNSLSDEQLINLLTPLTKLCSSKTEFTIECNPESVTVQQAKIFKKFKVNRVSLGAQTTNNILLKEYGRHHTIEDVKKSLNIFKTNGNPNISLDFIYGFNDLSVKDIKNAIEFIKKNKINHVSFYSLEIKQGSILNSNKYKINETKIENQLKTIINLMQSLKFNRYEVSSWAKNKKYESIHNKAYWQTKDWAGVGTGAWGLENRKYYTNIGNYLSWKKKSTTLSKKDYYFQILMMGLRLSEGINLNIKQNKKAYEFYKEKLKFISIKNNHLVCNNINLLDATLIDLL